MTEKSNILIVVEGNKTEPRFFQRMAEIFGLQCEIYCFSTNIYTLYRRMKEYDFDVDIKDVLKEEHKDRASLLDKRFAYTYLVFDCDLHHPKKLETREEKKVIFENFAVLREMAEYFTNETDPTIGKLYINYPMMESYRDADDFFEEEFRNRMVLLSELKTYKQKVAQRKLCRIHLDHYGRREFELLVLQNLYKWYHICHGIWKKPDCQTYQEEKQALLLLEKQQQITSDRDCLSVINTSLFLILDYYGNRDGFYDGLLVNKDGED